MAARILSVTANASATSVKLRAGVTSVVPSAGVTYVSPVSGVSAVTPAAGVVYTYPASEIAYILLASSAYLDTTGRFKYTTEVVSLSDSTQITTGKIVDVDYAVAIDAASLDFAALRADTVAVGDVLVSVLIFIRDVADSVSVSDTLVSVLTFIRSFADTAAIADATSKFVSPAYFETVTPNDTRAISTSKNIAGDAVSVADAYNLLSNKGLSESLSLADSGTLISQGYCDITYFAEDYVGESRTF